MEKIKICILTHPDTPVWVYSDFKTYSDFSNVELIIIAASNKSQAYQKLQGQTIKGVIVDFNIKKFIPQTTQQIKDKEPLVWTKEYEIYQFCLSRIR